MKAPVLGRGTAMALGILAGLGQPALADGGPSNEQLLRLIQQQQKAIDALKAELSKTRQQSQQAVAKVDEAAQESEEAWWNRVTVGGVIEVEATNTSDFVKKDTSDLALAKVEAYIDANPARYLNTHVQFIFEDGSNNINLDEAWAIVGDTAEFPLYGQAGFFAVPFGNFDTDMSTDPLTKDMGETKEATALLGLEWNGFSLQGYAYNGDSQRSGGGDNIDQGGFFAGYGGEQGDARYDFGLGYISNLADSDGLTDATGATATALGGYIPGFSAHGMVGYGPVTVRGAYLTALDDFTVAELPFNGQGSRPGAWHLEGAYAVQIMGKETIFAATAQGTKEALALGLPEYRYGGAITVGVIEHMAVTAEYLHDEDYEVSDGGTGEDGHIATLKLAVDF